MASKPPNLREDRLQDARPGEPVDKWIYSAFQKDHWVARKSGDLLHADHPGTALQVGEDLFEILTAEETLEPGFAIRYGLKKWDPQHALRGVIPYTPETRSQAAADFHDETSRQALRSRIVWLFPLAGMMPDPLQRDWEARTALNMTVVAAASALVQILIFMALVQTFGRSPESKAALYALEYLGFDAFVRLLVTVCTGKPRGVFALALPYLLWESIFHPERRAKKKQFELKFSLEGDEVIRRPGTGSLVIRSMLFDDLLAGSQPIRFDGAVYRPLHWHREGKGLDRRWVYEFEKIDADPRRKYREYTQPRRPERQKVAEDFTRALDRAQMLGLIWGTYPSGEQTRLEARYQFPAAQMTAATAGLILAGAVIEAWALAFVGAPTITYLAALYFVLESLYRLYVSKAQGRPAGSLVGWVLSWFLHPPR
jgi:hypothetical protein